MPDASENEVMVWIVGEMPDGTRILSYSDAVADEDTVWIEGAPESISTLDDLDTATGEAVIGWYTEPEPHSLARRSSPSAMTDVRPSGGTRTVFTEAGVDFALYLLRAGMRETDRRLNSAVDRASAARSEYESATRAYAADPVAPNLVRMELYSQEVEAVDEEVEQLRRKASQQRNQRKMLKEARIEQERERPTGMPDRRADPADPDDTDRFIAHDGRPGFRAQNGHRVYPDADPHVWRNRSGRVFVVDGRHIAGWDPKVGIDGIPRRASFEPLEGITGASYDKFVGLVESPPGESVIVLAAYRRNPPQYKDLPSGMV